MSQQHLRRDEPEPEPAAIAPGMHMEMRGTAVMTMSTRLFDEPDWDSTRTAMPSPATHEAIDDGHGHGIGCYVAKRHPGCE